MAHICPSDRPCRHCKNSERQRGQSRPGAPGVPVYDEGGAPFASSISKAARALGLLSSAVLHSRYLSPYRDGYQLIGRPNPANVGRTGLAREQYLSAIDRAEKDYQKNKGWL